MALFKESDLRGIYKNRYERAIVEKKAQGRLRKLEMNFSAETKYDIFLSHNSSDAVQILNLKETIEKMGFSVYVHWTDSTKLDRTGINEERAHILRERMKSCKSLIYATFSDRENSKWMPWELGYFDGLKGKVAILPVRQSNVSRNFYGGQEYLGLYNYVTKAEPASSQEETLWVHRGANEYVIFSAWLHGAEPVVRC
ncbi:MAG: hypothetical protein N4A57_09920 [Anaeromicrobium sp.]|jgi:hypothetical protein|uniref:hypothetical protein n=1 Tax=Anaeromicrobium sp. TaxID=1929132 RepID=UPI0025D926BE|nr:hypothetical protein [Anaeromicrobium sp.]MCT4594566.1 hypothetical protein [Anaeromicrobium sp.]